MGLSLLCQNSVSGPLHHITLISAHILLISVLNLKALICVLMVCRTNG
jgi:hypothetical protein